MSFDFDRNQWGTAMSHYREIAGVKPALELEREILWRDVYDIGLDLVSGKKVDMASATEINNRYTAVVRELEGMSGPSLERR